MVEDGVTRLAATEQTLHGTSDRHAAGEKGFLGEIAETLGTVGVVQGLTAEGKMH